MVEATYPDALIQDLCAHLAPLFVLLEVLQLSHPFLVIAEHTSARACASNRVALRISNVLYLKHFLLSQIE